MSRKTEPTTENTTVTPALSPITFTDVVNGKSGHTAAGFTKATIKSQIDFRLGLSLMRDANPANDTPVFDSAIVDVMGDAGLPQRQEYDSNELTTASAAGFVLLSRHIKTPHPETGRKEEYLTRFLKSAKEVITAAVDYQTIRNVAQTKATCEMLKADPAKRIESLHAEAMKKAETLTAPAQANWLNALKEVKDQADDQLVDMCLEAMVNAGDKPEAVTKEAAIRFLTAQRKRMEAGQFVSVDAGVYALAQ